MVVREQAQRSRGEGEEEGVVHEVDRVGGIAEEGDPGVYVQLAAPFQLDEAEEDQRCAEACEEVGDVAGLREQMHVVTGARKDERANGEKCHRPWGFATAHDPSCQHAHGKEQMQRREEVRPARVQLVEKEERCGEPEEQQYCADAAVE